MNPQRSRGQSKRPPILDDEQSHPCSTPFQVPLSVFHHILTDRKLLHYLTVKIKSPTLSSIGIRWSNDKVNWSFIVRRHPNERSQNKTKLVALSYCLIKRSWYTIYDHCLIKCSWYTTYDRTGIRRIVARHNHFFIKNVSF